MDIKQALSNLDPKDDTQWTGDGMPLVEVVSKIAGRPVTRKEIIDADPDLTRAAAVARLQAKEAPAVDTKREEVAGDTLKGDAGAAPALPTIADPPAQPSRRAQAEREVADMTEEIEELERDLAQITRGIEEATKDRDRMAAQHTRLCALRDKHLPAQAASNGEGIRSYLAQQNKVREDRAARIRGVVASGVKLGEVLDAVRGASRIDAAMGGRRGPVGNVGRPNRPLMGGPGGEGKQGQ